MRFFPDDSARKLVERLRDDLVELLGRRTGGYLNKSVDGVSGGATRAAETHTATSELAERQIPTGSRAVDRPPESAPLENGTLSSVTGSRSDEPSSGRAEPFVVSLTRDDREAFAGLAGKLTLSGMINEVKYSAMFTEMRGTNFSPSEKRLVGILDKMQAEQGGKLEKSNLEFRWVGADEDLPVPELVKDARVNGGGDPDAPWTHTGTSVVEDILARSRGPGVLFIYDGDKLRTPTKEEMLADPNSRHMFMHAKKPLPGLELKDALMGMIRFDEPGAESRP